ncbi:alpha-2-macroglobulin family protein [Roseivirga sp.]|uniref:alpha-2-macroglobulin family protein n=1 Tax=Roseivirga sp. TaxID=1964215 RepID=UPI003B5282FE
MRSKVPFVRALCLLSLFVLFNACQTRKKAPETYDRVADEQYADVISAYTTGKISSQSVITVQLAENVPTTNQRKDLLSFSPSIKGETRWVTPRVVEFRPGRPLPNGAAYVGKLKLDGLEIELAKDLKPFEFTFNVIAQDFDLDITGINSDEANPMRKQVIRGTFNTADFADTVALAKAVTFEQEGKRLNVTWDFDETTGKNHSFTVLSVDRKEEVSEVDFFVEGNVFGADRNREGSVTIPSLNDFSLISARLQKSADPYVVLNFSDPLNERQDLNGLITLEGDNNPRFLIEGNEVRVYPSTDLNGNKLVRVYEGIRNQLDFRMAEGSQQVVNFSQIKPQVRLTQQGSILPSSDGLILPFDAVNVRAVEVTVIKVSEANVFQFLQVNELDGNDQLRRVGKPIVKQAILLDESGVTDFSRWNRFTLDLANLITPERGAIYQVRLNLRQEFSLYQCEGNQPEMNLEGAIEEDNWNTFDIGNHGEYDSYYDYNYGYNYDWRERENPCHESYYAGTQRMVKTNVLASDLGMIAKLGNNRTLTAFVTDLKTTKPISGLSVNVYDYQQELLQTLQTDAEGRIILDTQRKPFLLEAVRGVERGYLKLTDGTSLSVSNFNVGGARVERGIQGFIYGERGVWRPGDPIYLDFILEDKDNNIPDDHPVVLEFLDPSGNLKDRKVSTQSVGGFYPFQLQTADDDPTGNWLARVNVGGSSFTKRIKIETIKPNRLKINFDLGRDRIAAGTQEVNADLNVKWLTGATAKNLKAEFDLYLNPARTTFEDYPAYSFDDVAKEYYPETERIFEGRVDAEGKAKVPISLVTQPNAPGMLMATFSGKVYEPGGDFSIDQFSVPFYPYTHFVGLKKPEGNRRGQLLTERDHVLDIVSVDAEGNPVDRSELVIEAFKLQWRWWWDRSDNLAYYVSRNENSPYFRQRITTENGKAQVQINVPNEDWGRYYIRVRDIRSGHSAGSVTYFDWPGWSASNNRPGGASLLNFSTDKEDYKVGEEVTLRIPASTQGRALVSIENGSKVIEAHWVETKNGSNEFSFEVTPEMAPNVYINATLLQPHAQTRNDLPIRLYGIVPINVTDDRTVLRPEITMPEVLKPEESFKVEVSELNGKPMTYTIAVADEGLLDITRFNTPNPWNTFYARQALGVKSWDIYDDVIGAFNGDLSRLLALGGDGSGARPESAKANRFKPVVKHLGPFQLERGKKASHTIEMPNYIGSVRTMVIAGDGGAYGSSEKATPVRKPLMVLGTLPRVLGPGEKLNLPVSVFALEDFVKEAEVEVKVSGPLQLADNNKKTLKFNSLGDELVDFGLEVKPELGVGKVEIIARSGREVATHEIEIQIRNPNPPVTSVLQTSLQPGESWEQAFEAIGMNGTNSTELELSILPPINLGKRLGYLVSYPHGCIEQTTSSVFPQLFLSSIMEVSERKEREIQRNIIAAIDRLSKFQTAEGGFAYWPGQSDDNEWGTNYAGHFMLEAREKGYDVPTALFNSWKSYQGKRARQWARYGQYNDDIVQAYRLYTLAKAQSPELGAMNRLREDSNLSLEAKWRLAAAYALTGRVQVAKEMINALPKQSSRKSTYYYYGSQLRDNAMILETMGLLNMRDEGMNLLRSVADALSEDRWLSTQTTAYGLLGVIKFVGLNSTAFGNSLSAEYQVNNGRNETLDTAKPIKVVEMAKDNQSGQLNVKNNGESILFVRLIQRGQPLTGQETSGNSGLRLQVQYFDRNNVPIDPANLAQGTDFTAEVTVYNTGSQGIYRDLALSQVFPSGWEILNDRLNEIPGASAVNNYTYRDIRDDRVYTYFDLRSNDSKTFKVNLNATYGGKYYLPVVTVEAMYDNTIYGREAGKWVEVKGVN